MKFQFKDKELNEILKKLTVIVDSREQENSHILDFFDKKKINYKVENLSLGDYSCLIPKGSFQGQERDIYFSDEIVVERKNSIDEVAGNLKDDTRILKELAHLNKYDIKYYVFLEDANFDDNVRKGNYRSEYQPKSLYARLKTIEARYNTIIRPIDKQFMGSEIYNTFYYYVREVLKNKGFIEGEEVSD